MSEGIFHLGEDGNLTELRSQGFVNEDDFQDLLARHPLLLPSTSPAEDGERWLLIQREAGIPDSADGSGRWSLDHLFVDREGVPTLVEVKRSTDTRIRREVVGQMLDYAANAVVYWPVERLRSAYESRCEREGLDPAANVQAFLGTEADPEVFWSAIKTNLQAGKVRMIFVADVIPKELQRIVEFLNEQMDPAEVLAVEIRQYVSDATRSLVPRLIGRTAEADTRKGVSERKPAADAASLIDRVRTARGDGAAEVTQAILEWAPRRVPSVSFGSESFTLKFAGVKGLRSVFTCWDGSLAVVIDGLSTIAPFDDPKSREGFLSRFASIPGAINNPVHKNPGIRLSETASANAIAGLIDLLDFYVDAVNGSPPTVPRSTPSTAPGTPSPAG